MGKIWRIFFIALTFALSSLLTGCKYILLDPKGIIASDEKHIMMTSVLLMLIVVIPVILLTFAFAWRYRACNTKATYTPDWCHSTLLEIIWWSIPCLIILVLGYITWTSSFRLDPYKPLANGSKPIQIQVISLEWRWLFIYPEQKIASTNLVEFPVNVPIEFLISAEGPMNSFQIPALGGQIYAMAGMQTKLHLIANSVGDLPGISANFTGDGFSDMKFNARVVSLKEFNSWVNEVKHSQNNLTMSTYEKLTVPTVDKTITYFSTIDQQIFANVMMKTMMPMPMKSMAETKDKKIA